MAKRKKRRRHTGGISDQEAASAASAFKDQVAAVRSYRLSDAMVQDWPNMIWPDPYHSAHQRVAKLLNKVTEYGSYQTFRNFVAACNLLLDELGDHLVTIARTGQVVPGESQAWKDAGLSGMSSHTMDLFGKAFAELIQATELPDGTLSYADVIGSVFMAMELGDMKTGQYFTPWNVALAMAHMSLLGVEDLLKERLIEATKQHPQAQAYVTAMGLMLGVRSEDGFADWFNRTMFSRVLPVVAPSVEPITIADPCCGSGIMLLAAARLLPRWTIDYGIVRFFGSDISQLCVDMCQLNMRLYGIGYSVLKPVHLVALEEAARLDTPYRRAIEAAHNAGPQPPIELTREFDRLRQGRQLELFDGQDLATAEPLVVQKTRRRKKKQLKQRQLDLL